jgi:hypothetical protein
MINVWVFLVFLCPQRIKLTHNGPAIKLVGVTWRSTGHQSWYFSQKTVTVQGRYGACFCSPDTKYCEHYVCRAEGPDMRSIVRGTSLMRAIYLSPVTSFMRCKGAVRVYHHALSCLGGRSKSKNRDEPINFIVRVMVSCFFNIHGNLSWGKGPWSKRIS